MLLFKAFCWFKFISANIMPTLKQDYVSYSWWTLMYVILCGIKVDMAAIIKVHMRRGLFKNESKGWYFPL